jgi:hypothetical protein
MFHSSVGFLMEITIGVRIIMNGELEHAGGE